MKKDTNKLLEELKNYSDFNSFYEKNKEDIASVSLGEYLQNLIESKGLNKAEIIEKSEMSEVYAYQIISGTRQKPNRNKVICLALGMGLSFEETQQMLVKTGYSELYVKNPSDCIIIYGLCKGLSVIDINEMLFDYGQETLG